jgi:hypothetical protein
MASSKGNRRRERLGWGARAVVWLFAVAIGAVAGWWGRGVAIEAVSGPDARIAGVAVTGNERVQASELVRTAGLSAGIPLATIDIEGVRAALLAHPWIRSARVTTLPPDHVIVAIEERVPVAIAVLEDGERFVDGGGTPFAAADPESTLPRFEGVASADARRIHPRFAQALHLLDAAAAQELPVPDRVLLGGRPEAELPALAWDRSGSEELLALLGDREPDSALQRLAQAWMADLAELRNAREVDLRFDDQLILRGTIAQGEELIERPAAEAADSLSREG